MSSRILLAAAVSGMGLLVGCSSPNIVDSAVDEANLNQMRLYQNELADSYRARESKINDIKLKELRKLINHHTQLLHRPPKEDRPRTE